MHSYFWPGRLPAFTISLALSLSVVFSSCGGKSPQGERPQNQQAANTEPADAPVQVTVAKTEARNVPAVIQTTGSLVADETSNVAPKVAGKVANVNVNIGDFVSQGSVIAKIDDSDARRQLASAQASVKQAIAAVRQAEARLGLGPNSSFNASAIPEVRSANANYEQALAELRQAEANEKRYRDLVQSGDTAMITYEQYRTARDTARARANAAKEQLDAQINNAKQNNQAIASAQASVEAAQTQVETAKQELADTVVRAPFSGFVTNRQVAPGEYVSSANTIATIIRSNPIKIQMQVAEADVPSVLIGRGVSVQVDAYRDRRFAGTVSAINPSVDPNSRSAIVEAKVENGDNALRAGMFATARINKEGGATGIFVPRSAVYSHEPTGSFRAFVIVDGVAKLRVIQLGAEEGDSIQILSGLSSDETVATSNLDQLYEGAKVTV
ncbi:MAG: efflux RND transporter periplasmic adaptor subunit [Pyrinomonadaceae bacterium]|nr:efflux RND transporter periplasmic adaptor subunit [Blastocatellia bacterium]MCW5956611.1 efflux RND transporter periplasmic adaptor subunit [Pyrinomonadaceae bacterium]